MFHLRRTHFILLWDHGQSAQTFSGNIRCARNSSLRQSAIAGFFILGLAFCSSAPAAGADAGSSTQSLGSLRDYVQTEPDYYAPDAVDSYESPALGIAVQGETVWSRPGRWVDGVEIVRVVPGSPAGAAGLQGSSPGAVGTGVLFFGLIAGAAICPPMMFGVIALGKLIQPHETIIAVDGERTRNVFDFEDAVEKAQAGEIAYLTVLSHGRREQVAVPLAPRS